jgi:uncharacterized protein (TIGR02452 family)
MRTTESNSARDPQVTAMASKTKLAQTARETIEILERGSYIGPEGREVSIRSELKSARSGTVLHKPDDFEEIFRRRDQILLARSAVPSTGFEVVNETTLGAARRLLLQPGCDRVFALNFASGKNAGGGFLKGSQAQEESLARASGLYACINPIRTYYDANRSTPTCLYTDHMIYSPDVPVFRDDNNALLDRPYQVSILTAPAPNAGAVKRNEPRAVERIGPVMRSRIEKLLALAVVHEHQTLVLGAWGCGVFANDPDRVSALFAEQWAEGSPYRSAFRRVVFAVFDRTPDRSAIGPFASRFGTP